MKFKDSVYANTEFLECSFNFGTLYLLPNIIVTEFNEGIMFTYDNAVEFIDIVDDFYKSKSNVFYISNRINSYAVNPLDWIKINKKFKNLKAIGIVQPDRLSKRFFNIEKMFCPRKIEAFDSLDEAMKWVGKLLKNDVKVIELKKTA